jgi:hypothetical protein
MKNHVTGAAAFIVVALFFACRPAKHLQKEDEDISRLKARWVADWVKDHPCPQLPPMNLDSLCALNDFSFDMQPSDLIQHDTVLRECPPVVRRILVPYQDTRTEDLLYDSLKAKTERIAMLEGVLEGQNTVGQIATTKKSRNTWLWAFIGACVVVIVLIGKDVRGLFK